MSVYYCLFLTLFSIDRNSRRVHQLHSHQHFCPIHVKLGSSCYDAECDVSLFFKKNVVKQYIYHQVLSSNTKLAGRCDCKIGGNLPAAVCKLIITPPGIVSLT